MDKSADDDGDGSSEDPFREIDDALEEAGSGETIYVKEGEYDGGFTVKSSVKLYGENKTKTVIKGAITLKDGALLKNLTVRGGHTSVTVEAGAKVTVESVVVEKSEKMGIDVRAGSGKLILKNSQIKDGSGKGVYIQAGNDLEITGSEVSDNNEEGLDLRDHLDGTISSNEIHGNGESGIEIILGSSNVTIKNNSIYSNDASGVATQFYSSADKTGDVKISNNKIKNNGSYGINCSTPSGGGQSKGYWNKSLSLEDNTFSGNKEEEVRYSCKIDGFLKEEKNPAPVVTDPIKKEEPITAQDKAEEERKAAEEEANRKRQIELTEMLRSQAGEIEVEYEVGKKSFPVEQEKLIRRSSFRLWFLGTKEEDLEELEMIRASLEEKIGRLDGLLAQAGDNPVKGELEAKKKAWQEEKDKMESLLAAEREKKGVMGWLKMLFVRNQG